MAKRINFTKTALEQLIQEHDGKRVVVYDTRQPGLIAELREGGSLSFYVYRRLKGGPPLRRRIGAFPQVGVEQARDEARTRIADMVKGLDPDESIRRRRQEPTLADLYKQWIEHAREHKKTWREDQRQFKKLLRGWHTRRLSAIKQRDVRALHQRIKKQRGRYAANRLLALISAMYKLAPEIGYEGPNPAKGITKFKEVERDRYLQPGELPAFFTAVEAEPNETLRDFFLACLYTGARRGNVAAMRWEDLDLEAATWRIPDTKSGEPVVIHLSQPAVELLRERALAAEKGAQWVFPGRRSNGKTPHLSSPKDAWKRLVERAGLVGLRMHDLRRTLGSYQAAAGASLLVIGKSLGHKSTQATKRYARLNLDPVRASVDLATAAIVAAGKKEEASHD